MSTILWTTSFLEGEDKSGSSRLARTVKFLDYYLNIQGELQFDRILLLDNASPDDLWKQLTDSFDFESIRFNLRLNHGGGDWYPYCWRGLYAMNHYIQTSRAKKLIYIDSDSFVLSRRMADWINDANTGWQSVWCKRYNFPEASIHIINEDAFPLFLEFTKGDYMEHCGKKMELVLPFTHINKELDCDRYGETFDPVKPGIDFFSQAHVNTPLEFGKW